MGGGGARGVALTFSMQPYTSSPITADSKCVRALRPRFFFGPAFLQDTTRPCVIFSYPEMILSRLRASAVVPPTSNSSSRTAKISD